jgi:hypothetical protein
MIFVDDSQLAFSFSDIFIIDATNEQMIETDLKTITPAAVGDSVEASLRWLAGKKEEWLLFFDQADDTKLNLSKFFPPSACGNILITTRNPQLRIHASNDMESMVSDMNPEDALDLLLQLSHQGKGNKQKREAAAIVKVFYDLCS